MSLIFQESVGSAPLFLPVDSTGSAFYAYLLPQGITGPRWGALGLPDIWVGGQYTGGYFIFCASAPQNPSAFTSNLWSWLSHNGYAGQSNVLTYLVWLQNPDADWQDIEADVFPVSGGGAYPSLVGTVSAPIGANYSLIPSPGAQVKLDLVNSAFTLQTTSGSHQFVSNGQSIGTVAASITINLTGLLRGCLQLQIVIQQPGTLDVLDAGLRFYTPGAHGAINSIRYPIVNAGSSNLTLYLSADPALPVNPDRCYLSFGSSQPALQSFYQTALGQPIQLTPVPNSGRLAFIPYAGTSTPNTLTLAPACDFTLSVPGVPTGQPVSLLCGLAGTESISALSGTDVLSFVPLQPALATFDPTQTNTAPPDQYLSAAATTSWVSLKSSSKQNSYYSQPQASPLFEASGNALASILTQKQTPFWPFGATVTPAPTPAAPVLPFLGLPSNADSGLQLALESYVVSKARKQAFLAAPSSVASRRARLAAQAGAPASWATDPRGIVVGFDAQGNWSEIDLSVSSAQAAQQAGTDGTLTLINLAAETVAALEGNQVFLVATTTLAADNSTQLFAVEGDVAMNGWDFTVNIPNDRKTAAASIVIFKFYDKSIADLASMLSNWTDASDFNGDPAAIQSTLNTIIQNAQQDVQAKGTDSLYSNFVRVVTNPNWNGVLILNAAIATVPAVIQGALVGIPRASFIAHHVGIQINDISPPQNGNPISLNRSSMFALVDYEMASGTPPPATADPSFVFQVNYLRALFLNSMMLVFQSQIGISLNALFGIPLQLQAGNNQPAPNNMLTLNGVYQAPPPSAGPGATGIYSFISTTTSLFDFNYTNVPGLVTAQVLYQFQVNQVQFAPVSASGGSVTSRFSIWGALVLGKLSDNYAGAFDVFNFDSLPFSNLGLLMTGAADGSQPLQWSMTTAELTFNQAASQVRAGGLVGGALNPTGLPLKFTQFLYAPDDSLALSGFGYQPLALPAGNPQQADTATLALVYSVDFGTAGTLSSSGALTGNLITAWDINGGILLGLQIAGIGNEAVLKLEGLLKVYLGGYQIDTVALANSEQLTAIRLKGCTFELIGKTFPASPAALEFLLVAPPPNQNTMLWYASYNPATQPSS